MQRAIALNSALMLATVTAMAAQTPADRPVIVQAATIQWTPAPPVLEAGAMAVLLDGDPSKAAPFTLRVRLPANYRIAPHRHSIAERLTVLAGTLCFATRDAASQLRDSTCLGPGAFRIMPANVLHTDWTTGPVEYQIEAIGPFDMIYLNPQDDPTRRVPRRP